MAYKIPEKLRAAPHQMYITWSAIQPESTRKKIMISWSGQRYNGRS